MLVKLGEFSARSLDILEDPQEVKVNKEIVNKRMNIFINASKTICHIGRY
jgi:hypothetical protein